MKDSKMTNPNQISKKQAWEDWTPHYPEQFLHLKTKGMNFQFTRKWFQRRNQCTFSTFLPKLLDVMQPINLLQIGIFEGMDLCWQMEHVCSHPDSRVVAIDPWVPLSKIDQAYMVGVQMRARRNLSHWKDKIKIEKGFSCHDPNTPKFEGIKTHVLDELIRHPVLIGGKTIKAGEWDLIVIDGEHSAEYVFEDAIRSMQLCRVGGIMLFDDVRNTQRKKNHVQDALTKFFNLMGDKVETAFYHRFCNAVRKLS